MGECSFPEVLSHQSLALSLTVGVLELFAMPGPFAGIKNSHDFTNPPSGCRHLEVGVRAIRACSRCSVESGTIGIGSISATFKAKPSSAASPTRSGLRPKSLSAAIISTVYLLLQDWEAEPGSKYVSRTASLPPLTLSGLVSFFRVHFV